MITKTLRKISQKYFIVYSAQKYIYVKNISNHQKNIQWLYRLGTNPNALHNLFIYINIIK